MKTSIKMEVGGSTFNMVRCGFRRMFSRDWAPYREGHWAWIEPWGWTWVDDASFGFVTSHYGRWAFSR